MSIEGGGRKLGGGFMIVGGWASETLFSWASMSGSGLGKPRGKPLATKENEVCRDRSRQQDDKGGGL